VENASLSYDFEQNKVLDPLSLSMALKQVASLSAETQKTLSANLPTHICGDKITMLNRANKELEKHMTAKFTEAFEARDVRGLVQSIQVFFNLEALSEQIQNRVNLTLRQLFQTWKEQINGLNSKISGMVHQMKRTL